MYRYMHRKWQILPAMTKQMKNFMWTEINVAGIKNKEFKCINDTTDCINDTTGQKQCKRTWLHWTDKLSEYGNTGPIPLQYKLVKKTIWDNWSTEYWWAFPRRPAPRWFQEADIRFCHPELDITNRGIGSHDQNKYHHMINFLKNS